MRHGTGRAPVMSGEIIANLPPEAFEAVQRVGKAEAGHKLSVRPPPGKELRLIPPLSSFTTLEKTAMPSPGERLKEAGLGRHEALHQGSFFFCSCRIFSSSVSRAINL